MLPHGLDPTIVLPPWMEVRGTGSDVEGVDEGDCRRGEDGDRGSVHVPPVVGKLSFRSDDLRSGAKGR